MYWERPRTPVDPTALQQHRSPSDCLTCGCVQGGCGCGCSTPRAERDCRPKYIRTRHEITPSTAATCFPAASCRLRAPGAKLAEIEAWVRPRGSLVWVLSYPAFDRDDTGRICFRWDSQLFDLGAKRLEVEFRQCGQPCGVVELRIRAGCALDPAQAVHVERRPYCDPVAAPGEATAVFNEIAGFQTTLCAVLEPSGGTLKLCGGDARKLCAMTLCRPVELILDDGVNHEIVLFSGCTGETLEIQRGMGGTTAKRFPVGTTLRFGWTQANVLAAQEGCP